MRPFTVFCIKLLVANFVANIADNAGDILVSLALQTVLPDASHIEVIVQFARLGIGQFQFADEFR